MADFTAPIKPKKSSTASEVPQANDLEVAEIAINTADGLMWTKHTDNSIVQIGGGGASAINELTDVTITSATSGQVLKYDGAEWINQADEINYTSNPTIPDYWRGDLSQGGSMTTPGEYYVNNFATPRFIIFWPLDADGVDFSDLVGLTPSTIWMSDDDGDSWTSHTIVGGYSIFDSTGRLVLNSDNAFPITGGSTDNLRITFTDPALGGGRLRPNQAIVNYSDKTTASVYRNVSIELAKLPDVNLPSSGATEGQTLVYRSASGKFDPSLHEIESLDDFQRNPAYKFFGIWNVANSSVNTGDARWFYNTTTDVLYLSGTDSLGHNYYQYLTTEIAGITSYWKSGDGVSWTEVAISSIGDYAGNSLALTSSSSTEPGPGSEAGTDKYIAFFDPAGNVAHPVKDNQYLNYDEASGKWHNVEFGDGAAIGDLEDVTITTATTGQVLKYNGSVWTNDTDNSGGGAINDLSDVTITSATTGQVLKYDGAAWINDTDNTGGLTADLTTVAPVTAETLKYDGTNFVPAKDRSILSTPPAIGDASIDHDETTSNFNVDLTTINEGDFLVIVLMTVTNGTTTPPAGWTLHGTYLNITNGANDQVLKVYTRTATASETRPYAFQDTGANVAHAMFSVPGVSGIESVTTNTGNGDTATIATVAEKLNVTFATWIYSDPAVETHSQSAPGLTEVHENPGGIVANARLSMGYTTEGTTVVSKHYTTTTTQNPDPNHQMINIQFAEVYSIDSLTDVDTTTTAPTAGDFLRYDGTTWVNSRFQADDLIGEGPLLVSDTETAPLNTIIAEPALQVASSTYDGCQVLIANTALSSTGPLLQFANTRAGNAVIANDFLGEIEFRGTEGQGDLSQAGAKIVCKSTGTAINNEVYAELGFETAGTADIGVPSRRLTIKDNGIINLAAAASPTYADDAAAGTGGLVTGDIYKTATGELRIKL